MAIHYHFGGIIIHANMSQNPGLFFSPHIPFTFRLQIPYLANERDFLLLTNPK